MHSDNGEPNARLLSIGGLFLARTARHSSMAPFIQAEAKEPGLYLKPAVSRIGWRDTHDVIEATLKYGAESKIIDRLISVIISWCAGQ